MRSFKEMREACWTGYKQVGQKKKGNRMVPNCVPEEAPANAVGDGSNVAMPPAHEPGVHVKKKKKDLTKLLKREDYDKVELENFINKIDGNDEVIENQIQPILKNLKRKQQNGTYNEQVGIKTFRYVVDNQIKSTVSEEFRNEVALELLKKYVKEYVSGFGVGLGTFKPMGSMVTPSKTTLSAQKIKTPAIKPDFRSTGEKDIKDKQKD